jgi:hypothetical protein
MKDALQAEEGAMCVNGIMKWENALKQNENEMKL